MGVVERSTFGALEDGREGHVGGWACGVGGRRTNSAVGCLNVIGIGWSCVGVGDSTLGVGMGTLGGREDLEELEAMPWLVSESVPLRCKHC